MPICLCCLEYVEHYQEMKDGTKICEYCIDTGRAIIKDGEVLKIKEIKPITKKKPGRKKKE